MTVARLHSEFERTVQWRNIGCGLCTYLPHLSTVISRWDSPSKARLVLRECYKICGSATPLQVGDPKKLATMLMPLQTDSQNVVWRDGKGSVNFN